jgi:hypothetical protein
MEKNIKRKILRPLSAYDSFFKDMGDENDKIYKGLIIGQGHNHNLDILSKMPKNIYWYMIDIDKNTYPDYICDASNIKDMSYFPDNYFDYILTAYCPVIGKTGIQYIKILKNLRRLIKYTGTIYLTELPDLFFWLINDDEYKLLKNKLINMIDRKDLSQFLDNIGINNINDCDFDDIAEILVGNHEFGNKNNIKDRIRQISIDHTKKIMNELNFEIICIRKKFLLIKK